MWSVIIKGERTDSRAKKIRTAVLRLLSERSRLVLFAARFRACLTGKNIWVTPSTNDGAREEREDVQEHVPSFYVALPVVPLLLSGFNCCRACYVYVVQFGFLYMGTREEAHRLARVLP